MYSYSLGNFQYNNYSIGRLPMTSSVQKNAQTQQTSFTSNPSNVSFMQYSSELRTQLVSKEEIKKYNELSAILDKETKKNLNYLLKSGILLNTDSNDKSTTLDNLYKIATFQRAQGLNNEVILQ